MPLVAAGVARTDAPLTAGWPVAMFLTVAIPRRSKISKPQRGSAAVCVQ